MFIRKFLKVSCIVSIVFILLFLYKNGCRSIKEEFLLELYIPRIGLEKKVYTIDSKLNNVDMNVEILKSSNINKNLYFLASHSGGGKASYFDNLIFLEKGDIIWIISDGKRCCFVVQELFYIEKNGFFVTNYGDDGNTLFLITCSLNYVNKQLVVKSTLIYMC